MTTAYASRTGSGQPRRVRATDPYIEPHRLPKTYDGETVSRFGDLRWDLSPLNTNDHQVHDCLNWQLFPLPLRESFRRAGWALVNLPTPDALLGSRTARRLKWPHPASMRNVVGQWCQLAQWLLARNVTELGALTVDDLTDYAVEVGRLKISTSTAVNRLAAVTLLWAFAPHLPPRDRIPKPPWHAEKMRDYLPRTDTTNENGTHPIHPAVMSPLLIWAIRFVDDFADDILTAWLEHQTLIEQIRPHANPAASATLRKLVEQYAAENRALPGRIHDGHPVLAVSHLAGRAHASKEQASYAVRTYGSHLPVADQSPLRCPIQGRLDGRAWMEHINFHDAPRLMHRLSTACLIVILYLTGMRPGEALELRVGCCPEPGTDGTGPRGYQLHGNYFKGARDSDGKHVMGGLPRDVPWTVIPPVVRAVRVLERMADGPLLFPTKTAWATATSGSRKRSGEALTCQGANARVAAFTAWANDYAARTRPGETIPDDPHGPVRVNRFRRTLAWHIARLPGGRVALALQYGHLRPSTVTDGYAGRARDGLRRILDIETARAVADYLDIVADRLHRGEHVSGPAARRLISAATQAQLRFEGMFLTPKQAKALLAAPQFHVYDNPEAFLTCNYDPAKALCHPGRASLPGTLKTPAIDRCDPACANVARTDAHIDALRGEIARLRDEIVEPITPMPLRERLGQRATQLNKLVEQHERSRPAGREGAEGDR
ncbi:MAG: integrase [Citromicrobium sp.]|nr:MAG: integrase [Citromicrobium sp.]